MSAVVNRGTGGEPNGLARYFEMGKYNVTVGGELAAGFTTFLVMAYIAFVNPGILTTLPDRTGFRLDFGATVTATCWVASILCIVMGVYARRPFALAPGLGLNAVVTFQLVGTLGLTWQAAMGLVMLEGIVITILVLTGLRQAIMEAVPAELKRAIAAGIGLFILYIGLNQAGLVAGNPTYAQDPTVPPVALGNFTSPTLLVSVFGLLLTVILHLRGNRGALLIGIVGATIFSMIVNYLSMAITGASIYPVERGWGLLPKGLFALPTLPYFFGLSVFDAFFQANWVTTILNTFALMLSDFFDTMGTLVGVSMLAGFLTKEGRLPGVEKPLLVDSVGPIVGGAFAASSATTYIESGGGVAAGGRTGFVAVVVGLLFFLVPFFTPLIAVVPPQATSAALIVVGFFMIETIRHVEWGNFRQAFPVLLTMIVMPLTYSITNGIGFGFILYTLIAMFTGGARKVHPLMYIVSASFVIYFLIGALELWLGL